MAGDRMRVVAIIDQEPTSDPTHPDYDLLNDPNLNIQYVYDQIPRSMVVEKRPEDLQRMKEFCFGDLFPEYRLESNAVNEVLVDILWNMWNENGIDIHNIDFTAVFTKLGLTFDPTPEQLDQLLYLATAVVNSMRNAFKHIYRNYQEA